MLQLSPLLPLFAREKCYQLLKVNTKWPIYVRGKPKAQEEMMDQKQQDMLEDLLHGGWPRDGGAHRWSRLVLADW